MSDWLQPVLRPPEWYKGTVRIVVTETVDPDGALCRWMSPDFEAMGHQVVILPVQEGIHRLGASAWRMLLLELGRAFRPDLVIGIPPYDYLDATTANALREGGARLLAFGFDDAVFLDDWRRSGALDTVFDDYAAIYDVYATTCAAFVAEARDRGHDRFVTTRWAMSLPESPAPPPARIPPRAVLAGRAYPTRIALVKALAEAGIPVVVRGFGWPEVPDLPAGVDAGGYVDGEAFRRLFRDGVVISTADWETSHVPMVKARVLETAFSGACQVAAWAPELEDHFPSDEVASFRDIDELIAVLRRLLSAPEERAARASAAQTHALAAHTWRQRFGELLGEMRERGRPAADSSPTDTRCVAYAVLMQGLASTAEATGRPAAAARFYALAARAGAGEAAELGTARCRFALGDADVAETLIPLWPRLEASLHAGQRSLYAGVRSPVVGVAQGHNRFMNPAVEAQALAWMALVRAGDLDHAVKQVATERDPDRLVQVAALLGPEPGAERFFEALYGAAVVAQPRQTRATWEANVTTWRRWLAAREAGD